MGFWNSGFVGGYIRFCTSGFGLGATPAKALGITVLIFSIIFVIAFYAIKWTYKLIKAIVNKSKENKANQTKQE